MTKIMLVEDDNNLREIYQARLNSEGYETVTASDGEEALSIVGREKPDLIILDVMMPKISGFDTLDLLKNSPVTRDIKVIMMTALSQAEDRARAQKLGAQNYLVKSQVTLEDIVKAIKEALDGVSVYPGSDVPSASNAGPETPSVFANAPAVEASTTPGDSTPTPPSEAPVEVPAMDISTPTAPAVDMTAPMTPEKVDELIIPSEAPVESPAMDISTPTAPETTDELVVSSETPAPESTDELVTPTDTPTPATGGLDIPTDEPASTNAQPSQVFIPTSPPTPATDDEPAADLTTPAMDISTPTAPATTDELVVPQDSTITPPSDTPNINPQP